MDTSIVNPNNERDVCEDLARRLRTKIGEIKEVTAKEAVAACCNLTAERIARRYEAVEEARRADENVMEKELELLSDLSDISAVLERALQQVAFGVNQLKKRRSTPPSSTPVEDEL